MFVVVKVSYHFIYYNYIHICTTSEKPTKLNLPSVTYHMMGLKFITLFNKYNEHHALQVFCKNYVLCRLLITILIEFNITLLSF